MSATKKLPRHVITCAIAQVVGELDELGQEASLSAIAAFLGCTKRTAQKYATKAIWSKKLKCVPIEYRKPTPKNPQGVKKLTYKLDTYGVSKFNSDEFLLAKKSVYETRGVYD